MSCFRRFITKFPKGTYTNAGINSSTAPSPGLISICNRIKTQGPITVAEYMRECLLNPIWGYYTTRDNVLGSKGDFITSPEISQVFGELIGVWVMADLLTLKGKGYKCNIVELGPGKGSLSKDIIRVFDQLKKQHCGGLELHLVEASSKMAAIQYATLTGNTSAAVTDTALTNQVVLENGVTVNWYRHLSEVPRDFAYYIAHEFFDALPVHQFKMSKSNEWREILVDITNSNETKLRFIESHSATPATISYSKFLPSGCTEGEVSPDTLLIVDEIADRVTNGGAALIADYGEVAAAAGKNRLSLRGFQSHKESNVLENPGTMDLTADVDFGIIKNMINEKGDNKCHGPITQNEFLHKMGIRERVNALMKANESDKEIVENLLKCYEMLSSPEKMGERFKFMCITGKHRHIPTPF